MLLEPVLVGLDGERPHEPQATFAIGEDAHDLGAAPDLLVQPFQHIGRFEVLMVLPRQPIKEPAPAQAGVSVSSMFSSTQPVSFEYLPDHLVSQAAKSRRASMRSRRSPGSGFAGPRTGSQPAQLLQTVVVDPARDVVERVAQKMHVAALIGRLRQNFAQRCPHAGMIIGHDELDAIKTARLQPQQEIPPARSAQIYPVSWSWYASSPKDPVIATS